MISGPHVQLIKGDFLDGSVDWSDGDVIFAASTSFPPEMMQSLATRAAQLKPGSRFLSLSLPLPDVDGAFRVVAQETFRMSWGNVAVFLQVRT